jgi:hypothetical protein
MPVSSSDQSVYVAFAVGELRKLGRVICPGGGRRTYCSISVGWYGTSRAS